MVCTFRYVVNAMDIHITKINYIQYQFSFLAFPIVAQEASLVVSRGVHSLLYFAYTCVRDLFIGGFIYLAKKYYNVMVFYM
jgi:hypothetical protein